ncbi:hypothetical protein OB920_13280 [Halobacteria archaeon HArc-gm2]|nr:hypothetical protein [Halobacteria archaeon HArc-gm2]
MAVPWGDVLTGLGLILNMVGVVALTLTDLFSSKPIRMWWFYVRHVDRENPESVDREPPVNIVSPVGGGLSGEAIPSSTARYENTKRMMRNQSIAAIGLIGGFLFQFIALFIPSPS